MNKKLLFVTAALSFIFGQTTAQAQLVVYEGFEYVVGDDLTNANTGTGFGGAWTTAEPSGTGNPHSIGEGLSFSSLSVAGGSVERDERFGRSTAARTISAAAQTALTADGSTVYFSVLADPTINVEATGGQFSNTYGTLVFGNAPTTDASNGNQAGEGTLNAGDAVGVGFYGGPTGFEDGGIQGVSFTAGVINQPDGLPDENGVSNSVVTGDVVSLIVGEIVWGADGAADDTITLYNITDPTAPLPAPFSTQTLVVDQTTFNIISISDGQTSAFDEIRFGMTLADVLPTSSTFVLGDASLNGVVDFDDIAPFITILANGTFLAQADIDGSTVVDFDDIAGFIEILAAP